MKRTVFALILALLLALSAFAGDHDEVIIRGAQDAVPLFTRVGGPITWKCSTGMTCSWGSGVFTMTATPSTLGKLSCTLGVCTLYDDTAVTGVSTFGVRAGAGQGSANLQEWKNAAGAVLGRIDQNGAYSGVANFTASSSMASAGVFYWLPADLGISRTSAGRAQFNNGTAGKWGGLDVGSLTVNALATPGAPTVTPTCPGGVCGTAYSYTCEALAGDGTTTLAGAATSTGATQAAVLDATHFNTVTCPAVTGASYQNVRRSISGGTPATLGSLAGCTGNAYGTACVDNGLVGDASAAPTLNTTGMVGVGITPNVKITAATPGLAGLEYALRLVNPNATVSAATGILFGTEIAGFTSGKGGLVYTRSDSWGRGRFSLLQNSTGDASHADAGQDVFTVLNNGSTGIGTTSPDRLFHVELADSATNAVSYVSRQTHITSGTATTGFGAGSEVELENASGTNRVASTVETSWTDAVDATEDSQWKVFTRVAGSDTLVEGLKVVGVKVTGGEFASNYFSDPSGGYRLDTTDGIVFGSTRKVSWSTSTAGGTIDVSIARAGANALKITDGSTGYGALSAAPGGLVPARRDYTLVCQANLTSGTLTNIVVASNAATATCTAGGCGMINGQTAYVIGATTDTDLNAAYVIAGSTGTTDTTVTFTTVNVTDGTYEVGSDAGMSFQGCLLNGASYTGNIAAATTIRPVLFSLTAGSKIIGNTVYWPAAWTGPGTLTGSVGATSGADDTFYAAASNLMAATSFLDTSSYKSKLHASADNTVLALVANTNFGDATLPILKLNGSVTVSVTW